MRQVPAVFLPWLVLLPVFGQTYTISTFAGGGLPVNIRGTSASLSFPQGVAVDSAGNSFFPNENTILRLDSATGIVTLVAGNGGAGFSGDDGPATVAQLNGPRGVAVDSAGDLYIADTGNSRIRKVANGVITTVTGTGATGFGGDGGPATAAQMNTPYGVALDAAGNLYIADSLNDRIRRVSNGVITTVAGNGAGNFSGDNGPATSAQLSEPLGVAVDPAGNLYIADYGNNRIREVANGVITTVAGSGMGGFGGDNGPATSAQLYAPSGVAVDPAGTLHIADTYNYRVRKVANGVITTVAGNGAAGFSGDNGPATAAQLYVPAGVALDSFGSLYIADAFGTLIRRVSGGVITTVAGNGTQGYSGDGGPATAAQLGEVDAIAVDSAGNLYLADWANQRIRKIANGVITTVAQLGGSASVAVDSAGNLYSAEPLGNSIDRVANGVIAAVAGNGTAGFSGDNGPATAAQLNDPNGVAVDSAGNLYIADTGNHRIRMVSNGVITTVVGTFPGAFPPGFTGDNGPATAALLNSPGAVAVDSAGNLYIADGNRIRKVANGVITTVAGNGTAGFSGDNGPAAAAQLNSPWRIAVDSAGDVYLADSENLRVRILTPGTLPAISTGGVVPIYSTVPVVQPGSWVSIYGSNLGSGTFVWNGDFPTSLGGTSVIIDNKLAYLWYVNPFQINLQVPDDTTTGPVSVVVYTSSGSAASTVTLAPYGPSFCLLGDGKHVAGEILTPDGSGAYGGGTYDLVGPSGTFSYSTRPVKPGETLVLYGVGFGPSNPHVSPGQAFTGAAPTTTPVGVTLGGVSANVAFAGITEAGLYQFNLTVPFTASGDQTLQASANGIKTPPGPVVTVQ